MYSLGLNNYMTRVSIYGWIYMGRINFGVNVNQSMDTVVVGLTKFLLGQLFRCL